MDIFIYALLYTSHNKYEYISMCIYVYTMHIPIYATTIIKEKIMNLRANMGDRVGRRV